MRVSLREDWVSADTQSASSSSTSFQSHRGYLKAVRDRCSATPYLRWGLNPLPYFQTSTKIEAKVVKTNNSNGVGTIFLLYSFGEEGFDVVLRTSNL